MRRYGCAVRVLSIDHVVLTVRDLEATVAFYEALGMRREHFEGDRVALRFGEQKLNLHAAGAERRPHARAPAPGSADLCLLVADEPEALAGALADAGIAVELGPVRRSGATGPLISLYVRDPDGNLVELSRRENA